MEIAIKIIGGFFLVYTNSYIMSKLLTEKKFINLKRLILILIYSILIVANYSIMDNALRLVTGLFISVAIFKLMFNQGLYKTIGLGLTSYVIIALSEITYIIFAVFILQIEPTILTENSVGILLSNIIISIIMFCIYKLAKNKIRDIIKWSDLKKDKVIIVVLPLTILCVGYFFFNIYEHGRIVDAIFYINIGAILVFCYLIFRILKEQANTNKLSAEHHNLLKYVKTTETLITEYRKLQHEYINQLATIKGLDKKEIDDYISEIINHDSTKEYNWINKLSFVPDGGLKGLLYYKIAVMKEKNINVSIDINKQFKNARKLKGQYFDLCKMIGIYLDNAIEATSNIENKEIIIEFYKAKRKLHIVISNTFENEIELEKLFIKGYSTKGFNRGFGLALVNEIIGGNNNIIKETRIQNNYFIQEIIIK